MNLDKEISRGIQAERILNDPIYVEAMDKVRNGILNAIVDAPIRDREGVHELKLMLKLLKDVDMNIREVVQTGKMALIQSEQDRKIARLKGLKVYG